MQCDKCMEEIESGEEREHNNRILCEDCYMDALSPVRTCDPWAVHSAKSLAQEAGARSQINPLQSRILEILSETGGTELKDLCERLQMKPTDLEREIASLRHMERVRGELRQGRRIIRLW